MIGEHAAVQWTVTRNVQQQAARTHLHGPVVDKVRLWVSRQSTAPLVDDVRDA